jgi:hypothetical protein
MGKELFAHRLAWDEIDLPMSLPRSLGRQGIPRKRGGGDA